MRIELDPATRSGSLALSLAARLLRAVIGGLSATWRFEIVDGGEQLEALRVGQNPAILSFWHDVSIIALPFLRRELIARGVNVTLLASQSRDGELATRFSTGLRLRVVRGSASRGGREALRLVYRAVVDHRSSPVMIPDGPHGPRHDFKVGVAVLAQMTRVPILPLGLATDRCWRLKSWDRLAVPKPFARVCLFVGPPQSVPRGLAEDELDRLRQRLGAELDRAAAAAAARC